MESVRERRRTSLASLGNREPPLYRGLDIIAFLAA
jgi:hypothetical protein